MNIVQKINKLLEERNVKKNDFYTATGTNRMTISNYLNEKTSPTIATLGKIAAYFNVPIKYFFDDENTSSNSSCIGHIVTGTGNMAKGNIKLIQCQQEISMLKERLKDKEELIAVLKKLIEKK